MFKCFLQYSVKLTKDLKTHFHPKCIAQFRVAKNCHLGNDSQSEHCIQQMNRFKTKAQVRKAAWVNMGL